MAPSWEDLPEECWLLIFNRLDHLCQMEPVSLVSKQFLSISNRCRATLNIFDPTIQDLPKYLQRFTNVKMINLSRFHGNLHQALVQIVESGVLLEELDVSGGNFHTVPLKELAGSSLRNLKVLRCSSPAMDDEHLATVASIFPLLEEIDISYSYLVTDKGITAISCVLGRLRRVDLRACFHASNSSLISLSSNCPNLDRLMVGASCMGCEGISFALRNSRSLSTLNMGGINLSDFNIPTMFSSVLSSLILTNAKITDEVLESISRANLQLKRFMLIRCKDYTFSGVSCVLKKYPCLKSLALDGVEFLTDESINRLRPSISKLEHLSLNFCPRLSDSTFMTLVETCGSLSILEMAGTNIGTGDEKGLRSPSWRKNHQLIKLNVSSCPKLSNNGLKRLLSCCPSLQWLDSPNCFHEEELDIADILEICSGILHLNIQSCGLVKFSNQQKEPMIVELEQFVAGCSGIDDEVLELVGRTCPGLYLLDMSSCEDVTTEGVKAVAAACTRLRYLNLSWCDRVSAEILDWLVSTCGSLRHLVSPSDSDPESKQISEFLRRGCLVDLSSDDS